VLRPLCLGGRLHFGRSRAVSTLLFLLLVWALIGCESSATRTAPPTSAKVTPPARGLGSGVVCITTPHACEFPDATNTGVPPGVVLTRVPEDVTSGPGWEWRSGGWLQVTGAGALINGLDVHGSIDVCADCYGTSIRDSRVTADGSFGIIIRYSPDEGAGATGVTITDTEVQGGPHGNGAAITAQNGLAVTIKRVNLHNTSTGIQLDRGSITDSYIWGLHTVPDGTHVNGTTSNGGQGTPGLVIHHNTILNPLAQTDAVSLFQDFGTQADVLIDNNLLAGGGYCVYGGQGDKGRSSNIRITNNRISRIYYPNGGYYGWLAHFNAGDHGNVLKGNIWDDTGAPIS
jgi:hypothetical protein